ncbi:hypothetical protein OSH45_25350, partial [Mycobacterium ulcerans]
PAVSTDAVEATNPTVAGGTAGTATPAVGFIGAGASGTAGAAVPAKPAVTAAADGEAAGATNPADAAGTTSRPAVGRILAADAPI